MNMQIWGTEFISQFGIIFQQSLETEAWFSFHLYPESKCHYTQIFKWKIFR